MKSELSLLVIAAGIVSSTQSGYAARVNRDLWASTVFSQTVSLPAGSHTFVTRGNAGVDTVLHLYSNSAYAEVAMNDDCRTGQAPGNQFNSCITYTVPTPGFYTVIVHSFLQSSRGGGDIYKDGVLWYQGTYFGGARVANLPGGATAESDYYETVLKGTSGAGNGCTDTVVYALDSSMHLISGSRPSPDPDGTAYFDDDAGVGYSSRIIGTAASSIGQIVVGSYSAASEGYTDLYVNDYLNDTNGNGLGQQLDAELDAILTSSLPTSTATPTCL